MQDPEGQVVSVNTDSGRRVAVIRIDGVAACARCKEGKGCGAGLLGGRTSTREIDAGIADGVDVASGDVVRINLEPANLLRASMVVYGYPLLAALVLVAVARLFALPDVLSAAFALGGLFAGLLLARRTLAKRGCIDAFTPLIVERVSAGQA